MEYRALGKTGLQISAISLGTEYLVKAPRENVVEIVHNALEHGVNYFDMVFSLPEYRDNFAAAFQGYRDRIILNSHLGSAVKDGQYMRTRNAKICEEVFYDQLTRFRTDHVDVLFALHNLNTPEEYEKVLRPKGVLELAHRLQREGKARFLAMSGHNAETCKRAVQEGIIDVLMFPVHMANNASRERRELLELCASRGVGVVAMKPFAGGKLLQRNRTISFPHYQTGIAAFKKRIPAAITPVHCLSYVLAQTAVAATVPGAGNMEQWNEVLAYLDAGDEEKDFADLLTGLEQFVSGECVYCNHCLPCPVSIDVGETSRLVDLAAQGVTTSLQKAYGALPAKASACTRCGACDQRCPFGVAAMARMGQAAALFEGPR